jgi:hypothetical protein
VAEVNAVKRLLRGAGRECGPRGSLRTAAHWTRLLASTVVPEDLAHHVQHHYAVWRQAAGQVRALDLTLGEMARGLHEIVRRPETVPSVGPIVALTAIAVFTDVARFESAKHAASYSGLVPSTFQSVGRDAHGHITKRGSAELRTMLCEAAHHARRPKHPLHPHFARVCTRRGYKTAVVAVAHRLRRLLFALLCDGSDFQPECIGIEEGTFTRTVTYRYRLTPKPAGLLSVGASPRQRRLATRHWRAPGGLDCIHDRPALVQAFQPRGRRDRLPSGNASRFCSLVAGCRSGLSDAIPDADAEQSSPAVRPRP